MIKTRTFLYFAAFLTLVFLIYFFENKVDGVRSEIAEKNELLDNYKQEITILEAEWSYQNNPERLSEIMFRLNWEETLFTPKAEQFTDLRNIPDNSLYFSKVSSDSKLR